MSMMNNHGVGFSYNCLLCLLLLQCFRIGVNACGFRCGDGSCIGKYEICNGWKDCTDGSDETRKICEVMPCRNAIGLEELLAEHSFGLGDDGMSFVSSFRCEYGGCISINFKCNGISNCADGSDETAELCKDTTCNANSFRCDYGACISRYEVCDHVKNCQDGSDERPENCRHRASLRRVVCPKRSKKYCDNRRECYDLRRECDGKFDCSDKSDEKAELCPATPPPPTTTPTTPATPPPLTTTPTTPATPPPPTTTPTTAPDPLPPVVFPVPGRPSLDDFDCLPPNCRCPLPGLEHFCLPCGEIADLNATCRSLDDEAVCHATRAHNVAFEVLSCGTQTLMTTNLFSRMAGSCVDRRGMVPSMTLVYVNCWNVSSQIMRCHSDGYWRVIGAQMSRDNDIDSNNSFIETQPMKTLCQPYYVNSQVCGRRSRYKRSGRTLQLEHFPRHENRWPMVMGLIKEARYECSATLISPRFLLTAAHCIMVSRTSRNQTMDVRDLKVKLDTRIVRVTEIIIHPDYQHDGLKPLNDLALVRLEHPIVFHSKLYPACVDLDGRGFLSTSIAVTFSRHRNGVDQHRYHEIHQQIDTRCFDRMASCNGLQIEATQFCGHDIEKKDHLERGSSGGPFLQNLGSDVSEEWTVTGVVSFSNNLHGCNQKYTVFTAIKNYTTWITDFVHNQID